jgi:hypothetical protein
MGLLKGKSAILVGLPQSGGRAQQFHYCGLNSSGRRRAIDLGFSDWCECIRDFAIDPKLVVLEASERNAV